MLGTVRLRRLSGLAKLRARCRIAVAIAHRDVWGHDDRDEDRRHDGNHERVDRPDRPSCASLEGHQSRIGRPTAPGPHPNEGRSQTKSSTTEPSARNGPNGIPIVLPARPWRTSRAMAGTTASTI